MKDMWIDKEVWHDFCSFSWCPITWTKEDLIDWMSK